MNLDDDKRAYIWWDAVLTFDPTGSTVVLDIDGTSYPMTWQGTATTGTDDKGKPQWTQTARSNIRFAGSSAPLVGSDVRLTTGRRIGEAIVTLADGQIIPVSYPSPIDVT